MSPYSLPAQPLRVLFRINGKEGRKGGSEYPYNRGGGAMTLGWLRCQLWLHSLSQPQLPTEHFPLINLNRLLSRRYCRPSPTTLSCAAEMALKRCHYKFIGTWEHTHSEYYERVIIFNCRCSRKLLLRVLWDEIENSPSVSYSLFLISICHSWP